MNIFSFAVALLAAVLVAGVQAAVDIELFNDEKSYKTLLKTRPNLLILFSKSGLLDFPYCKNIDFATVG